MKNLKKIFLSLVVMSLISCAGPYTIKDSGKTVNLGIFDPFQVELHGNSSTGYKWEITAYDSTVIEQIGNVSYKADDDKIGSGGLYTWSFKTIGAGESNLLFVYKRSWEERSADDKTYNLRVVSGTMGRILSE
tara:strand:+ start:6074 stop:6472 length:399 start_codon:yes stop_codon:yes gene_type:complete